jgi:hypothetical protein
MESRLWTHIIGIAAVPTTWQMWQFLSSASIPWMTQYVQKRLYPGMNACKLLDFFVLLQGYQINLQK